MHEKTTTLANTLIQNDPSLKMASLDDSTEVNRKLFFFSNCFEHIFRFYDENQLPHGGPEPSDDRKRRDLDIFDRYDREDPAVGTKQITTGFRKWAERFLSACSGQRNYNYQVNRMEKWNNALQMHLKNNSEN